jgi:hypothetical protein
MEIMSWLTDVHGPRLTNSPITKRAADWAIQTFQKWGLTNPAIEWWTGAEFGRGWTNERTAVQVTAPVPFPVIAYPPAWSDGTTAPVTGAEVVYVPQRQQWTAADFAQYRGKLRGKVVIQATPPNVAAVFSAPASRHTWEELEAMARPNPYPVQNLANPGRGGGRGGRGAGPVAPQTPAGSPLVDINQCFVDEGVVAVLAPGSGLSHGGNVYVGGGGSRAANAPRAVPRLALAQEHYGRIFRILEKGVPVRMDIDVRNTFHPQELRGYNVIAELPGADKRDELVMLGAHFDSWHAGTGATDNASGSAVMMEAMRILKATGLPLRRTVRIGLWNGEEQGLIGSRQYVAEHFGTVAQPKPAHSRFSAYYNVDNGTGAIRGVYTQGNASVAPIFSQWMRVLNSDSISVGHINPGNTGGTDHLSFDGVFLPGFQFIQDDIEYDTRTHHSSMDVYERIQPVDMRHNAVVVATFVYLTANRDELLPRKTPPTTSAAAPAGGRGGRGAGRGTAQAPLGCPAR